MASILLIDEKPGVRRVLAEELAFQGYTVMVLGDAALANEIVKFSHLDLVILDPFLKGQHRWDLLLDIKEENPTVPVLIVTDFPAYRKDPRSQAAAGILVRGFDFEHLLSKIAEILKGRTARRYGDEPGLGAILPSPSSHQPEPLHRFS